MNNSANKVIAVSHLEKYRKAAEMWRQNNLAVQVDWDLERAGEYSGVLYRNARADFKEHITERTGSGANLPKVKK